MKFKDTCFEDCVRKDPALATLRAEYAQKNDAERRQAADWEYYESFAHTAFNAMLNTIGEGENAPRWPSGMLALVIDPLFAPALLSVGSAEYQMFRKNEAMKLFRRLLELPPDTEDLYEIIDKVGDFLLDEEDMDRAIEFYSDAVRAFPDATSLKAGLGYCYGKKGVHREACQWHSQACEEQPDNAKLLNDFGWALYEAGNIQEAISVLERAVSLSPDDYELARNNLGYVRQQAKNLNSE